jgi:peptidoglycan/xylan/chitin deacetylase (PgdA/CDA1 family)
MRTLLALLILVNLHLTGCQSDAEKNSQKKNTSVSDSTDKLTTKKEPDIIQNTLDSNDQTHYVYLTFDDGPYPSTPGLANLLTEKKVKSSFFIIGSQIRHSDKHRLIYEDVKKNPLFKIYNHTVTHAITRGRYKKYYRHMDTIWNDIQNNKMYMPAGAHITRLPGTNAFRVADYRFPAKGVGARVIAHLDSLRSNEALLGWHAEWTERESTDSAAVSAIIQQIVHDGQSSRKYKKHTVVLFHDFLFSSPESLQYLSRFIDELQTKHGCVFRWADEFPNINQDL